MMDTIIQRGNGTDEPNFGTRLVRICTVWGLGTGTAVALALTAGLLLRAGCAGWEVLVACTAVAGGTGAGSTTYYDYVKANMTLSPERATRFGNAVSFVLVLVYAYIAAALLSLGMMIIVPVGIVYMSARKQNGFNVRDSWRLFISNLAPHIAA